MHYVMTARLHKYYKHKPNQHALYRSVFLILILLQISVDNQSSCVHSSDGYIYVGVSFVRIKMNDHILRKGAL